jgi:D-alanyl-D-alanine carboxypeptidase
VNPTGFDDNLQYSTAFDLAELARVATANPLIAKIVKTKSTVVTDTTGLRTYYLENVNKLLGIVDGINGVKTGHTDGALEIVITKVNRNGNGIIVSLLGSKDRFGESQTLIEWAFSNYVWPNSLIF